MFLFLFLFIFVRAHFFVLLVLVIILVFVLVRFQVCYNAAISACGKGRQWQRAVGLLDVMREKGIAPDLISFNSAIDACGKGGRCLPLAISTNILYCINIRYYQVLLGTIRYY